MLMSKHLVETLCQVPPRNRGQLRGWIYAALDIEVPDKPRCGDHQVPMDYLEHAFFERPGDALVWANRGGGKTFYGAVATLLDMLFKPGIEIRILGGSLDQSQRMYRYLRQMLDRPGLRERVDGRMTQRAIRLTNGSSVELLAQSQTSVRGQRVQKLRCDEVELFDRDVWDAVQFVTRSRQCGEFAVRGTVEAFSTMHRPFGLMNELVSRVGEQTHLPTDRSQSTSHPGRLFKWCALDVMQRCDGRSCQTGCPLDEACGGAARSGGGFLAVDDVIAQRRRSSSATFAAEMLCQRPSRRDAVFESFDPARHVSAVEPDHQLTWIGGMDFGLRSPLVMLWAQLRPVGDSLRVELIDEHVRSQLTVDQHLVHLADRPWPKPAWLGVDPAGHQRNDQTGLSTIALLRRHGYRVRSARSNIADGLELIRRRLEPIGSSTGPATPSLIIHPRCTHLIEAMTCYHFHTERAQTEQPVKDGYDHPVDALRYMLVNLHGPTGRVAQRLY
jgi:hypothetical protein